MAGNVESGGVESRAGAAPALDVGSILDAAPFAGLPRRVFCFAALALVFDGFDIQAIAFAAPALLPEWGIARADLAPVLAAGLVGMGLGSLALGTVGDRWGRRTALLACMLLVGAASLACAVADDLLQLGIYRFLVGLGLGGAIPNASALMAEYAPARHRNVLLAAAIVGIPLGGLLGAELAAQIVPTLGWRSVFVVGAALPVVLAVAMWLWMPESPRFLARRAERHSELARLIARVTGVPPAAGTRFHVHESGAAAARGHVRDLWTPAFRRDTAALWLTFFCSVFAIYSFFSWLPTVLREQGLPITTSLRGALAFNLGGVVGSLLVAWLMTRHGSRRVLLATALVAIASTALLGFLPATPDRSVLPLLAVMTLSGACIQGVQVGLFPVSAHVYPTACRASGTGWALGVARFGGVLSAFAGSAVLALGTGTAPFFGGIALVMAGAFVGLLLIRGHVPPRAAAP